MNQLEFRPCTYKEYPKLRPILDGHSNVFDFNQKRLIINNAARALDESFMAQTSYVALHDGVVVAFMGGLRDRSNPFQLNMFCLVVKRGFHNQGIGTRLFYHVSDALAGQNFTQIRVTLQGTLPPRTKRFYQRLGFKRWFDEGYTGASDQDIAMMKKLDAPSMPPGLVPDSFVRAEVAPIV